MKIAVYPGSFDPVTHGHMDIIRRSASVFDKLMVVVLRNKSKNPLFTVQERVKMIQEVTSDIENVEVVDFDGLLIDFVHKVGAKAIVRGLRAVTDFEYELQMSLTNKVIAPDVETVFLTTNLQYSYLSSSIVKEIASYNGDISHFVDKRVEKAIQDKMK